MVPGHVTLKSLGMKFLRSVLYLQRFYKVHENSEAHAFSAACLRAASVTCDWRGDRFTLLALAAVIFTDPDGFKKISDVPRRKNHGVIF